MTFGGVSGFGKVPRMGDFVRMRAHEEPTATFEGWIQEAMAYGENKRKDRWPAIYSGGAIHAFVFRSPKKARQQNLLSGVFKPSQDAVGRRFPVVIGASILEQTVAPGPHLLPLVLGDYFEEATSTLFNVDNVGSLSDFERAVDRIGPPRLDSAGSRSSEYQQWSSITPTWTAWSTVYGSEAARAPIHAIHTIRECLATFRGQETLDTPLSLRLPLGGGGVAAAAFWIDVVRRIARWNTTVPSFFLHFDGFTGSMLLQLGDTPPSSLIELWEPDPSSDYVCDLMGNARFDEAKILPKLPPPVAEMLQRHDRPVAEFLAALAH